MAETDQVHFLCTGEGIVSGTPIHLNLTTESNFKYVKRCSSIVLSVRIYLNVFAEEEEGASALQDYPTIRGAASILNSTLPLTKR